MLKKELFAALVLFILFQGCSSMLIKENNSFIKVNNTNLELNGRPYYFTGTNFWYGFYLGSQTPPGNRERLIRELNNLQSIGITNLRILASSEESYIQKSLMPALQIKPDNFNEDLLDGLDFLISEIKKRDMHAVIYLNNYWEWSGGMAVYNKWYNISEVVNPYDSTRDRTAFMDYAASFYKNKKANEYFRKFIKKIVTRKNQYTEQFYFEDPTIMAWELANEPRAGSLDNGFVNLDNYYKWIDETAKYIHSVDLNHLVTTGSEGVIGSLLREDIFLKAHESKYIDYATFHLWAKNWDWFDAKKMDETYATAEKNAIEYFNQHMILSRKLNKPITLEEFGLPRDDENYNSETPTSARDKYYEKLLSVVYDSVAAGAPIAGTNFWAWAGEGREKNEDNLWRIGDPFTGDPPHEPQGINSVYDTDFTTINILKDHAAKMNILSEKSFLNK